jgi:hypothetical protein
MWKTSWMCIEQQTVLMLNFTECRDVKLCDVFHLIPVSFMFVVCLAMSQIIAKECESIKASYLSNMTLLLSENFQHSIILLLFPSMFGDEIS